MTAFALHARYVVPVDRPPLTNAYVTIDQGRFRDCSTRRPDCRVCELGYVALLPGLVNAHTHLEFSLIETPLGSRGLPLTEWIRSLLAYRARTRTGGDHEDQQAYTGSERKRAIASGMEQCLRHGATTVGEIGTCSFACYKEAAHGIDLTVFLEVLAPAAKAHDNVLDAVREQIDGLAAKAHLTAGISPHAPYTVPMHVLEEVIALARSRNMALAMHVAESEEELQLLHTGAGPLRELLVERHVWSPESLPIGSRPLAYLAALSRAPRALVIHGNYLRQDELDFLALHRHRMTLVYCPRTHAFFQHPAYPLVEALRRGVRVALGTDSRASNPDLSVWNEVRFGAVRHPEVPPEAWIRMATSDGAMALGRAAEAGSIASGKPANLVAIRLPDTLSRDPMEDLVASGGPVVATWYRGHAASSTSPENFPTLEYDALP